MAGTTKLDMTQGPLLGVLLRVALPITAANVAQSVNQIVNSFWVGRLGADAIAAVAASGPLFTLFLTLGSGLSTAGAVLVAQNTGARREQAASHSAAQTVLIVLAAGLVFVALGFLLAPLTLDLIGVTGQVAQLTLQYLQVTYLGLVPMYLFLAIQAMLQSVGEVKFAMRVTLATVVLNALLDPVLIFGVGSWEGWGVPGAALATVLSQAIGFLVVFRHIRNGRSALYLGPGDFRPDWAMMRMAVGIGIPASLEQGGRTFGSLLLMSLSALFGTAALAAYGIGSRVVFFWFTPMIGLSIATAAVVGQNIGAGLMERAEQAARVSGWAAFVGFSLLGITQLPLLEPIMRALAPGEDEVVRQAVIFGWAAFPFLGFMALVQALNGVFRGAGSTRHAMTLSLIMQYALQLPFAWGLGLFTGMGVLAVWWSYAFSNVVTSLLCLVWLAKGPWRRDMVKETGAAQ